VIKSTKHKAQK